MKLYLHIGNHKTGSTSIQQVMMQNNPLLREQNILYPRAGMENHAHHGYVFAIRGVNKITGSENVKDIKDLASDLRIEIERSRTKSVVLSSEEFISLDKSEIMHLGHVFDLFDEVIVIVYLRNQWDLIESSYRFNVYWDIVREREKFHESVLFNLNSDYHEYDKRLAIWSESFPSISIVAKNYDEESKKSLVNGFLRAISVNDVDFSDIRSHGALYRITTILLRMANTLGIEGESRVSLMAALQEFQGDHPELCSDRLYTPELIDKAYKRFESSNKTLLNKYGINLNDYYYTIDRVSLLGEDLTDEDVRIIRNSGIKEIQDII